MTEYMLTTIDNPYNPWTHWDEWYQWDFEAGYHTPSYLGRLVVSSMELSEADQDLVVQQAIDEIVRENFLGIYKKIQKEDKI